MHSSSEEEGDLATLKKGIACLRFCHATMPIPLIILLGLKCISLVKIDDVALVLKKYRVLIPIPSVL